jgi:hypothetical protein
LTFCVNFVSSSPGQAARRSTVPLYTSLQIRMFLLTL